MRFANPVSDASRLRYAAANIRQGYPTQQGFIGFVENEKCVDRRVAPLRMKPFQTPVKGGGRRGVGRPGRLPGHQKITADPTDFHPLPLVSPLGRPQHYSGADNPMRGHTPSNKPKNFGHTSVAHSIRSRLSGPYHRDIIPAPQSRRESCT